MSTFLGALETDRVEAREDHRQWPATTENAFERGWDARGRVTPDREAIARAIYASAPTSHWPYPATVTELADAILDLLKGDES